MILSKNQLKKIIIESIVLEDTRQEKTNLIKFVEENVDFLTKDLKISKKMLKVFCYVAIAISGRESSYGEGSRYKMTDWAETLISQLDWYTGVGRQLSIGPTQMKYSTASEQLPDSTKQKIGISGPGDLNNTLKALLATVGILAINYNKAKSKGYSSSSPGSIRGSENSKEVNKIFVSTSNAALDMAITAYNAGAGKIITYNKEKNYIPCFGPYCTGNPGTATYGYVAHVAKFLKNENIIAKE